MHPTMLVNMAESVMEHIRKHVNEFDKKAKEYGEKFSSWSLTEKMQKGIELTNEIKVIQSDCLRILLYLCPDDPEVQDMVKRDYKELPKMLNKALKLYQVIKFFKNNRYWTTTKSTVSTTMDFRNQRIKIF